MNTTTTDKGFSTQFNNSKVPVPSPGNGQANGSHGGPTHGSAQGSQVRGFSTNVIPGKV